MKKLLLLALLASCSGRCNAPEAGTDVLGPTADCRGTQHSGLLCTRGNQIWACTLDGVFQFTASCGLWGHLVAPQTEAP